MAIIVGFVIGAIVALTITNLPKIVSEGIKLQNGNPVATPTATQIKDTDSAFPLTIDSLMAHFK